MKKIKIGLMAAALLFGIGGALSSHATIHHNSRVTGLFWYPVDPSTNLTTDDVEFNETKENVIAAQSCKDAASQPICLFGSTNPGLAVGTNVGTPPAANRILEAHP